MEYNIHSQLLVEQNGDKWMIFPKVKDGKVEKLVLSALTQEGSYVSYKEVGGIDEYCREMIALFQNTLDKASIHRTGREEGSGGGQVEV